MELSDLRSVQVYTLDKEDPYLEVPVKVENGQVAVSYLHNRVCDHLDLSEPSREAFALFVGGRIPVRKLRLFDYITLPITDLTFQKWCFDPKSENKLLQDEASINLLFVHAHHRLETGMLHATKSQLQRLEGCLDPNFCTKKQYVQICQTLENYFDFCVADCRLLTADTSLMSQVQKGGPVRVICNKSGISFHSSQSQKFSWFKLASWSLCHKEISVTLTFHVSMITTSSVAIETKQAPLLVSAIMEFIKILKAENPSLPAFHSSMITTSPDGSTVWENCLLDAG